MSIIIRLQNLPWSANAMDIRQFFGGLQIPEGGVHIVGGELGDAFIAFSTDEDARQAFLRTDGKIKGIQIKLMLSSRTEMQRVIEQARNQSMAAFMLPTTAPALPPIHAPAPPLPAAVPQMLPAAIPELHRMPAAVPEVQRDVKERDDGYSERKRDRRRSRSKSRDRRDRSRDRRDRRHRDRSRTRSRDRKDRRRRDRSRSRNRSRDRESRSSRRDNRPRSDDRRESSKRSISPFQRDNNSKNQSLPDVWNRPQAATSLNIIPPAPLLNERPGILGPTPWGLDPSMKSNVVASLAASLQARNLNGFQPPPALGMNNASNPNQLRPRESWPPANPPSVRESFGGFPLNFPVPPANNNPRGLERRMEFNSPITAPVIDTIDLRDDDVATRRVKPKEDKKDLRKELNARRENNGRKSRFEDIETPVDACVAMEPFFGSYSDLRRFFNGLSINYRGIKVINDKYGHKTGVCFVQFRDTFNKNEAVKMNGRTLNNTQMKIKKISDKVFEDAIDKYNPNMDVPYEFPANFTEIKDFVCLTVEDLPKFVKEQDILHIFSQHPLISLHLNIKPKGGTVAYVKFSSKEVAQLAFEEKSHHVISGKPVTVKPCTLEEFNQVNMQQVEAFEEPPKPKDIGTDCLSISKLPSKTNERDISDLFSDIGVVPNKIHLMNNNLGFTGQAYCEFETNEDASKAVSKDSTALGQNTISVQAIARTEMEGILGKAKDEVVAAEIPLKPEVIEPPPEAPSTKTVSPIEEDTPVIDLKPDEPSTTDLRSSPSPRRSPVMVMDRHHHGSRFDNNYHEAPEYEDFELPRRDFEEPRNRFEDPRSRFDDTRSQSFDDSRSFDDFRGNFDDSRDNFDRPHRYESPRNNFEPPGDFNDSRGGNFGNRGGDFGPRRGPRGSRFGGRGGVSRFNQHRSDSPANDEPMEDEIPGCTVFMDNIPYKAGTNEILDFFEGYNSTNNVSRRYNPNNQPSGEAKVTFYSPDEAFRAVRELNGKKIWGRQIYLRQQ